MVCKRCGSELKDTDKFCGICGEPNNEITDNKEVEVKEEQVSEVKQENQIDIAEEKKKKDESEVPCLIFGILSLCICCIGIVFAIVSIVLGNKLKKETGKMPAGMICGIISLGLHAFFIILYIAIYVFAAILGVD